MKTLLPRRPKPQQGLSLIEVLVTIAIMAALLLMAVPFLSDWIASGQARRARAVLEEGYSTARSLALRNPRAVSLNTPAPNNRASGIRLFNPPGTTKTYVLVCQGDPASPECNLANIGTPAETANLFPFVVWWRTYDSSIVTALNNTAASAASLFIAFDNRGFVTADTQANIAYTISKGGRTHETGTMY